MTLLPLVGLVTWVLLAPGAALGEDLDAARRAMASGDHSGAHRILERLAAEGDAQAQAGLGTLYASGKGVAQDDRVAADWFRRAAEQGNPLGQYNLGISYLRGRGVDKDEVEAFKWVSLAAVQGLPEARRMHASIARAISPEHAEEGKRRAREWQPR